MVMSNTLVHRKNKNKKYNVRFFLLCSPVLVPQIAGGDIPPGFVTVYNQDGKLGESLIQCKPFRVKFFVIHSSQKLDIKISAIDIFDMCDENAKMQQIRRIFPPSPLSNVA